MKYLLTKLTEAHEFFVEKSPCFVGRWEYGWTHSDGREFGRWIIPFKMKMRYPIAYVKFMFYSLRDVLKLKEIR